MKFTQILILAIFNSKKLITFKINTWSQAVRAYLSQLDNLGKMHSIAFYLRKFTKLELNYKIYNKKLLAIINAF